MIKFIKNKLMMWKWKRKDYNDFKYSEDTILIMDESGLNNYSKRQRKKIMRDMYTLHTINSITGRKYEK